MSQTVVKTSSQHDLRSANESVAPPQNEDRNRAPIPKKVPQGQRRGLLAQLSLLPEYEDARDYPPSIKLTIVFIILVAAVNGPMGTSIMMPALDDVASDLNTSLTLVNISVGVYLITLGIFPLWWSSFSEKHGRRSVYIVSFGGLFFFSLGCAMAKSIGMLMGFRVLSGACSASVQSVGAGTIADMYIQQERGTAMGIYYLGPLCAPFLAPIIAGAIALKWGWRGSQWFLVIFSGVNVILIVFGLPETLRKQDSSQAVRKLLKESLLIGEREPVEKDEEQVIATEIQLTSLKPVLQVDVQGPVTVISSSKGVSISGSQNEELKETSNNVVLDPDSSTNLKSSLGYKAYIYLILPLKAVHFLRFPPVILTLIYGAPCFALLYFVNMTLTYCYARPPYNFSSLLIGLTYIPSSLTYIIASIYGGRWNDYLLNNYARNHNGKLANESRISYNLVISVVMFPIGLLIFGWCLDTKQHWVVPLIGSAIFGVADMLSIGITMTYIVDSLPGRGATGIALNSLFRLNLAAIVTFINEPLIRAIGVGPLFTILSGLIVLFAISMGIIKKRGAYWKQNYDLSRLYEKLEE